MVEIAKVQIMYHQCYKRKSTRFAGFATLPTAPSTAADELELIDLNISEFSIQSYKLTLFN